MKRTLFILLAACGQDTPEPTHQELTVKSRVALEGFDEKSIVIAESTTPLTIDVNAKTVLCSRADYTGEFLKVIIPQLAPITLYDHQNFGAGGPCMAAGSCDDDRRPEKIIDAALPTEDIALAITLKKVFAIDHDAKTCAITVVEELNTEIRGVHFTHERSGTPIARAYNDCL